jgi:hypothetical protein
MSTRAWDDMIVGDRMAIDQEFNSVVENSRFSRQQWGLIMTAVELDIEHPGDEERARLVADTDKLPHVMDELDDIDSRMNAMGGGESSGGGGGVFDSLKRTLGFGSDGGDAEKLDAAKQLAETYAEQLQTRLENRGRWSEVRAAAQN